jgi:hypothetical protein
MHHFQDDIWFHTGDGGQEVVEDLLGGHAELTAARADFQPAFLVTKIALGEIFCAEQNEITIIGEFHNFLSAFIRVHLPSEFEDLSSRRKILASPEIPTQIQQSVTKNRYQLNSDFYGTHLQ